MIVTITITILLLTTVKKIMIIIKIQFYYLSLSLLFPSFLFSSFLLSVCLSVRLSHLPTSVSPPYLLVFLPSPLSFILSFLSSPREPTFLLSLSLPLVLSFPPPSFPLHSPSASRDTRERNVVNMGIIKEKKRKRGRSNSANKKDSEWGNTEERTEEKKNRTFTQRK